MSRFARAVPAGLRHLDELAGPLAELRAEAVRIEAWGRRLAEVLCSGGRLLAAGNGGSAAQAAHLTSELIGRYRDDRPPFSAIALTHEPCAMTAIGNDYGIAEQFARQVRGHGRPGDIVVLLSTSGRSANLLEAADAAHECGLLTWALCGKPGSPLAERCHDALCVESAHTATVQEIHLISIHLLCAAFEEALARPHMERIA
jgi:D-sedoheptulose 7-phosphate isomerase